MCWNRRRIGGWMTAGILAGGVICGFGWYSIESKIPDRVRIVEEEPQTVRLGLPFSVTLLSESEEVVLGNQSRIPAHEITVDRQGALELYGKSRGSYQLDLKLFGGLQVKEIQVDVVEEQYAQACGVSTGIYLKSKGILVIGTGHLMDGQGNKAEPAKGRLQSGDYIEAIDGEELEDKEELIERLNEGEGKTVLLQVRREGELLDIAMEPLKTEDGSYKLGVWVRDDTQGIGTITYVDEGGNFGALGHGISDSDTGDVVEIESGALYETEILGIEKGTIGSPGVMAGVIYYGPGSLLGTITENSGIGIYGKVNDRLEQRLKELVPGGLMPVGYRQDIQKGKAWLRSSVSGHLKDYEIEIQKIEFNPMKKNKSLVLQVTDPELLALTGGIIQGMSGSPIIQNGKLVGAVTHVFVQDSTKGYGIFVEDMMEH